MVNDRSQGHFREWVQFCLVQSLDKDIAKQLDAEKLGVNSLVAVPPKDSVGTLSHQRRRTYGRHLQDLAWFSLFFVVVFKNFEGVFFT